MHHANAFVLGQMVEGNNKFYQNIPVMNKQWGSNLVVQIGTCCPNEAALATERLVRAGANEINLNVGCPSDNVQSGKFGCVLMKDPRRVAQICKSMVDAADNKANISVKCRIGVDNEESVEFLYNFIETVSLIGGIKLFIIHARRAWLKGLSPKQNRSIPQLNYNLVNECTRLFSDLAFVLNGGISDVESIEDHLETMDGVMLGRKIMNDPWFLQKLDRDLYGVNEFPNHDDIFKDYLRYADEIQEKYSCRSTVLAKPAFAFFNGAKARAFRGNLTKLLSKAKMSSNDPAFNSNSVKFSTLVHESIEQSKRDFLKTYKPNMPTL
ncbi:hypothetical protein BB561_001246 [Smittium simulii]|uniref:tRNA-dihydrouridine synthase n=1 Tax=Smittium simulii TaxID=133385 RepID=A0A2T9YVH4_9FUNG|nr:hypothetical protein BB561_001246 [Smittium simulii]